MEWKLYYVCTYAIVLGIDYPIFSSIIQSHFSCKGKIRFESSWSSYHFSQAQ